MKTFFRSIGLAMLAALFIAASSGTSFAQAGCDDIDGMNALDAKIRENYPKVATRKAAVDAGKQYLEKFGACEPAKEFVDWLKIQMPKWETSVADFEKKQKTSAMFARFDEGIKGEKYDEVYAAGRDILAVEPENLNIMVPLGVIGLYQSYNKNFKHNDDTVRYAKLAIQKLKAGAVSTKPSGKFGAFQFEYSKEDAISEMTYAQAYISYWAKEDRKGALPLYYEVSQLPGRNQNEPRVYGTIGDYYVAEAGKLGAEIAAMIAKQKAMATDEEKEKIDVEIKAKVGLFNGYSERAIDAFARAHKIAPTVTANDKTYKDGLLKTIQDLYKRRFDKETGMDAYIAATTAKPFPNPTSEVTPIIDPDPVTTTTSGVGAANGSGVGAANGSGVGAANGSGVGAASGKNLASPSGTAASKSTTPPVKPVAKKP